LAVTNRDCTPPTIQLATLLATVLTCNASGQLT
jgi:hypothetical protein